MKIYFILLFSTMAFSQNIELDTIHKERVQNNLMIYRIKYDIDEKTSFCIGNFESEIEDYLLKSNENFDLYFEHLKNIKYPKDDIVLFAVHNNNYFKKVNGADNRHRVSFSHGISLTYSLGKEILIGYNTKTNVLIFISGNIFKNCLANDFEISVDQPNSFLNFLKFKLYNYQINNLKFIEIKGDFLFFEAKSKFIQEEPIIIKVNKIDFDEIQVKTTKTDWTERGAYNWSE